MILTFSAVPMTEESIACDSLHHSTSLRKMLLAELFLAICQSHIKIKIICYLYSLYTCLFWTGSTHHNNLLPGIKYIFVLKSIKQICFDTSATRTDSVLEDKLTRAKLSLLSRNNDDKSTDSVLRAQLIKKVKTIYMCRHERNERHFHQMNKSNDPVLPRVMVSEFEVKKFWTFLATRNHWYLFWHKFINVVTTTQRQS